MRLSGTKTGSANQYNGLGDQLYDLGGARPTLDLNFANNGSLVDSVTGKTLVQHTRQSNATYVDGDGVIRNAVTNLLLRSEDLTVSPWSTVGSVTVTADSSQGLPFTGASVYRVDYLSTPSELSQPFTYLATNYTASVWVKGTAGETIRFTGQATVAAANYTLTGEWQRLTQAWTATASNRTFNLNTSAGVTAETIYVAAPQLEQSTTVGEYIPTTSTINSAPRFDHDPTTGESLGLLVEESRQNLVSYSEDLSSWIGGGTGVLDPAIADPAGNTGTVYYPSISECVQVFNANGASQIAVSCFVKQRSGETNNSVIQIFQSVTGTIVNLGSLPLPLTGTFTPTGNFSNGTRTEYPNGWYRFTFIVNADAGQGTGTFTSAARIDIEGASRTNYVWGVQVEAGSFPTSYIPTTTAVGNRAADVASISGSNFSSWYRQDEGTVFAEATPIGDNGSNQFLYSISDGAIGDEIRVFKTSGNSSITSALEDSVDGTTNNFFGNTNSPFGQSFKTAHAFANNYASRAVGGLDSGVDNSVTVPAVNQIRIGARMNDTFSSNLHLFRLTYWPQRLPDDTLQTITV